MKIRDPGRHAQELWQRMTKTEKINFFVITSIVLLLFFALIAFGIIWGVTGNYWYFVGCMMAFIGFGLSFPIIGRLKRKRVFKSITKSKKAVEAVARITNVWIGWQRYDRHNYGSKVKALTLHIKCNINGRESKAWYKLNEEELSKLTTEKVMQSKVSTWGSSYSNGGIYYTYEVTLESLDRLFRIGDSIVVKYILEKPRHCIIIDKSNKETFIPVGLKL